MTAQIKENLLYTEDHDWVKVDGNIATIGLTDFAQNALGDIVFAEVPEVGTSLSKDDNFGVVESIKSVTDLKSPLSGEVVESNSEVAELPESLNKKPYEAWFFKIKMSNPAETKSLMNAKQYQEFCAKA